MKSKSPLPALHQKVKTIYNNHNGQVLQLNERAHQAWIKFDNGSTCWVKPESLIFEAREPMFKKDGIIYSLGHKINRDEDYHLHEYWLAADGGIMVDLTDSREALPSGTLINIAKAKGFTLV